MVIFVDKSINDRLNSKELNEDEAIFFTRLAFAHREGLCYLCGNLMSIESLSRALEKPAAGIYRRIMNSQYESGRVMNLVGKVLVLTYYSKENSENDLPNILTREGKAVIAPVNIAMKWNLYGACCLLAEDLSDCAFYECIANYFLYSQRISNLQAIIHAESGGGSSMGEGLRKCVQKDFTPTLCIVDSDQKYDRSEGEDFPQRGKTWDEIKSVSQELGSIAHIPPYEIFPLEVHEIENLIPMCILQKIKKADMEPGLRKLAVIQSIQNGRPALFYDLKKGFPYIAEAAQREYWEKILYEMGGSESDMPPKTKKEAEQVPTDKIFFPYVIERKTLDKAVNALSKDIPFGDLMIENYLHICWDTIGALVLTWGCASLPSPT